LKEDEFLRAALRSYAVNKFSDSKDPQGTVWEARSVDNLARTVDNQMFLGKSCDT
jgi:hypothetical protein